MPIDDANNLAKYTRMIQNATSLGQLDDAHDMLVAAYQRGDMSYEAYMKAYNLYLTKHNLPQDQWTTAGGDAGGEGTEGVPPGALPEIVSPEAGYRRGLEAAGQRIGIGSGELGQYLRSRLAPTFALFGAQGALRGDVGTDPTAFQKYAQQTRGAGLGADALDAFRNLASKAQQGVNQASEGWGALQPWVSPENEAQRGYVGTLAREAAAGKYGGIASRYFLPSNERIIQDWETGPTGAQPNELLAYLKRAFGL